METIQLIHNEFDTSVDKLLKISEGIQEKVLGLKNPEISSEIEDGDFLKQIGFINTKKAQKSSNFSLIKDKILTDKTYLSEKADNIYDAVKKYQKHFPFHKFILYSQVIKILQKYNLFLGMAHLFKGDIPNKNIKEIKNFINKKPDKNIFIYHKFGPICINNGKDGQFQPQMYICAPKTDFKSGKNIYTIGNEIYEYNDLSLADFKIELLRKKLEDPIILTPVITKLDQVGFIVITKWGLEANDIDLSVPLLN